MPIFRVGSETGGNEASDAIRPFQQALNNAFFFNPDSQPYFETLKFFVLALRVSGRTKDFGGEGPEYFSKAMRKGFFCIDLTIPEHRWKDVSFDELRLYVLDGVRQCFEVCVEKARVSKELLDEDLLRTDFETGCQEIMSANEGDDLFQRSRGLDILNAMIAQVERSGEPVDRQILMKKLEDGVFAI